jgi:histidine triad (HIT) family protein
MSMDKMKNECLFCKFASGEIKPAIVYENEYVIAFLDINPAGTLIGHTLVVPKRHAETIDKLDEESLRETIMVIKNLIPAIKKVSGAEGINVIQNNGKAAGQFVMHVHFHIIPRKAGDGIRIDENRRAAKPLEQSQTAEAIKEALQKKI